MDRRNEAQDKENNLTIYYNEREVLKKDGSRARCDHWSARGSRNTRLPGSNPQTQSSGNSATGSSTNRRVEGFTHW